MHVFVFVFTDKASQQAPQHTFTNRETHHTDNVSKLIKIGNQANIHCQPNMSNRSKNVVNHPTNLPKAQDILMERTPATSIETCSDHVNSKVLQISAKSIKKCSVLLENISRWNLEFPLKLGYAMVSDAAFGAKKKRARGRPTKGLSRNNRIFKCSYCDRKLQHETSMIGHVEKVHFPGEPTENPRITLEDPWNAPGNPRSAPKDTRSAPEKPRITPEDQRSAPENPRITPEDPRSAPENPRITPEDPMIVPESQGLAQENPRIIPEDTRIAPNQAKFPFLNKNIEQPLTKQEQEHTSSGVTMQELEFSDNVSAFPVVGIHEKDHATPGYRAEHDIKDISMLHLENSRSSSTEGAGDVTDKQTVWGPVSAVPVHGIVANIAALSQQLVRDNSTPSQGPETKHHACADTAEKVSKENTVSEHWTLDKGRENGRELMTIESNAQYKGITDSNAGSNSERGINICDIGDQGMNIRQEEADEQELVTIESDAGVHAYLEVEFNNYNQIHQNYKSVPIRTQGVDVNCDDIKEHDQESGQTEGIDVNCDSISEHDQQSVQTEGIDVNCDSISEHDQQSVQTESIDVNCDNISEHDQQSVQTESIDVNCDNILEHDQHSVQTESIDVNSDIISEHDQHSVQTESIDVNSDNISEHDQHSVQTESIDVNCDDVSEQDQHSVQTKSIDVNSDNISEHDQHSVQTESIDVKSDNISEHDHASIDVNSIKEDNNVDISTARSENSVMGSSLETALNVRFPCQYCDKIHTGPDKRLKHCKSFHKNVYQQGIKDNALVDAGQAVKDNSIINPEKRIKDNAIVDLEQGIKDNAIADWEQSIKDNAIAESFHKDVYQHGIKDNAIGDVGQVVKDNARVNPEQRIKDHAIADSQQGIKDNAIADSQQGIKDNAIADSEQRMKDNAIVDSEQGIKDNAIADSQQGVKDNAIADSQQGIKDNAIADSQQAMNVGMNSSSETSLKVNDALKFPCQYCNKIYGRPDNRLKHYKSFHKDIYQHGIKDNAIVDLGQGIKYNTLADSEKGMNDGMNLSLETALNINKQFPCQYCDKIYKRPNGRLKHYKSFHKDVYQHGIKDNTIAVPEQGIKDNAIADSEKGMNDGMNSSLEKALNVNDVLRFPCQYCDKIYTRPDRRLKHYKSFHKDVYQHGIKDNTIAVPEQGIKDNTLADSEKGMNDSLNLSLETALNINKQFPCQYCDKIYKRPNGRLKHYKSFHKDVYQHGIKDNTIAVPEHGIKDNAIADSEKGMNDGMNSSLEKALNVNDVLRFPCQYCDKIYTRPDRRLKHYKSFHKDVYQHGIKDNTIAVPEQGIKDNAIADSEKGMNDGVNSSLEKALNINKQFPCQYCDKIYRRPNGRLKHYKSFHKDVYQHGIKDNAIVDLGQGVKDNAIADSKGIMETEEDDEDDISMARSEDGGMDSSDCDSQEEWSTSNLKNQRADNSCTDDSQSDSEMFKCAYCSKHFKTIAEIKLHEKASHLKKASNGKKQFSCKYCDKRYLRLDSVIRHCNSVHKDISPDDVADLFSCGNCPGIFSSKSSLKSHLRFCQGKGRPKKKGVYSCEYCLKVFRTKVALKVHIESSKRKAKNMNLACDECGEVFGLRCTRRRHEALHVFGCKLCKATFPSEDALGVHTAQNHKDTIEQEKCASSDQGNASKGASKTGENTTASSQTQENHRVATINSSQSEGDLSVNSTGANLVNASKNTSKTAENTTASSQTQDTLFNVDTINSSQSECDSSASATDTTLGLDKSVASWNSSSTSFCKTNRPNDTYTFSYLCNHCCKVFHTKKFLRSHVSEHRISRFGCHYCKERFASKKMLMEHFTHHDSSTPAEAFPINHSSDDDHDHDHDHDDNGGDLKYACPECGCLYSDIASLKCHIEQQGCPKLSCQHCNKAFHKKGALRNHLRKHHHQPESASKISLAESSSTTSKGVPYRRRKVELNKYEYGCTKCDSVFDNKRKMLAHYDVHELGEKVAQPEFNCELCNEKFWFISDVWNHAVQEHNDGNTSADAAEQQSPKEDRNNLNVKDANGSLSNHHTKNRNEADSKSLSKVIVRRDGRKFYICKLCPEGTFKQSGRSPYMKHMEIEHRETCHPCKVCDKEDFSTDQDLQVHQATHMHAYECHICHDKFCKRKSWVEHLHTHDRKNILYNLQWKLYIYSQTCE